MLRTFKKAQSTAEYAVILSLVIAAVIGMQVYVKRGLQARLKKGTDAFTSSGADFQFDLPSGAPTTLTAGRFSKLTQYEPYYTEQQYDTYSENVEQEHMGGGKVLKEKVSDINVRAQGGYTKQRGSADASGRNDEWETNFQ